VTESRTGRNPTVAPGAPASTAERILDAALVSFASRGYEATSLDALAVGLEVRKQTILYWFPSKEVLLEAVIDRSAEELSAALEASLVTAGTGWVRVEAVVRSVFRVAARRPELLGLLREMGRLGAPAATRFTAALEPLVQRAAEFLEAEMDSGHMRRHEPRLLLLAIYSTVIGMVTEVEVLRALGEEPTARSLVRRRTEILDLLRSALVTDPG
jgi:AcrR family transcriptional regulator